MDYREEVIIPGDVVSKLGHKVCVESYNNSPAVDVIADPTGRFRGLVGFRWRDHVLRAMLDHRICETPQSDGAGGKPQFFSLIGTEEVFWGLGWEIIAMNKDDVACGGGFPAVMVASNLDIKGITKENLTLCKALMDGFGAALKQSNTVLITGETAVMKHSITAFCDVNDPRQLVLTWSGACLGLMRESVYMDGSTIKPNMAIIGFKEDGYRCNGGTALTSIVMETWGPSIKDIMLNEDAMVFIRKLVVPSRSYATTLSRLNGWTPNGRDGEPYARIHAMAHITGGGVWSKFGELLPKGVGALLESMPEPPEVLLQAQQLSQETKSPINDYQCYDTFHGGCGVLIVCNFNDINTVRKEALNDGHQPYLVGITTESKDREVVILSKFAGGERLSSLRPE